MLVKYAVIEPTTVWTWCFCFWHRLGFSVAMPRLCNWMYHTNSGMRLLHNFFTLQWFHFFFFFESSQNNLLPSPSSYLSSLWHLSLYLNVWLLHKLLVLLENPPGLRELYGSLVSNQNAISPIFRALLSLCNNK